MDYEKKYKEALERAKAMIKVASNQDETIGFVNTIFPELRESEDERIRKAILTGLIDCRDAPDLGWSDFGGINIDECIAWLEKQGEKKNRKASYTAIAETGNGGINALITRDIEIPFGAKDSELQEATYYIPQGYYAKIESDKVVIKKGEQKTAWSEEDEEHVDSLLKRLDGLCRNEFERTRFAISEDRDWLKSLKERIE